MSQEVYDLNWHTYSDHLQGLMKHLMQSNESADVTLVCDDKTKFKAHKFVLNACSPVFQSIIDDLPQKQDSVIFLRGVYPQEMKSILQFMYLGQATFYQERMNEFLNVAKIFEIKEINKDVEATKELISDEYMGNISEQSFVPKTNEVSNSVIKQETKLVKNEVSQYSCNKCDKKYSNYRCLYMHVRNVHKGIRHPCNRCSKIYSQKINLIRHIEAVHDGVQYPCHLCEYKAKEKGSLQRHIESIHDGVKYPCDLCEYKATTRGSLLRHIVSIHDGV